MLFTLLILQQGFSQDSLKITKSSAPPKIPRNNWSLNFIYTDRGFGLGTNVYKSISNTVDLTAGIMISGVKDPNEFEQFDIFGNSFTPDKINRVYMIPISIGLQKYLFTDELDESFRPLISAGISPTIVLTNPYDRDFFNALGYFNAGFAFGGYAGIGMEYKESNNVSLSMNIRYSYLPVLVNDIRSLKDKTIKDVGGFQLMFGLNFLK